MLWASCLLLSGLYLQRVRLVPFVVLAAVAFVHYFEMREEAHFLQQLASSFFILSAMLFSRAPTPQKEFIGFDIILNSITFLAYTANFSLYPYIARITTPLITTMTALILIGITAQHKKLWSAWRAGRPKEKRQKWHTKEIHNGR